MREPGSSAGGGAPSDTAGVSFGEGACEPRPHQKGQEGTIQWRRSQSRAWSGHSCRVHLDWRRPEGRCSEAWACGAGRGRRGQSWERRGIFSAGGSYWRI